MEWAVESGYAWAEDPHFVEQKGCLEGANRTTVGQRAKRRGIAQLGTLGAGNHYMEIQYVDEIYCEKRAQAMGITGIGQAFIFLT